MCLLHSFGGALFTPSLSISAISDNDTLSYADGMESHLASPDEILATGGLDADCIYPVYMNNVMTLN